MPNIGPMELIILLVILLVIFGPKRLPGLGKQLGGGLRDFKEAVSSRHDEDEDEDEATGPPALEAAPADVTPVTPAAPMAGTTEDPARVPAQRTDQDA